MAGPSRNYSKELEKLLHGLQQKGSVPRLLLHACCAPCSSAVLEYLSQYFFITLLYYNPNIAPYEEYEKREAELRRLDPAAVVGIRAGRFGAEALILRSALPAGMAHQPATLEDIMLYHIKEEH